MVGLAATQRDSICSLYIVQLPCHRLCVAQMMSKEQPNRLCLSAKETQAARDEAGGNRASKLCDPVTRTFFQNVPRDEGRVTTMCASLPIYPSKLLKVASL